MKTYAAILIALVLTGCMTPSRAPRVQTNVPAAVPNPVVAPMDLQNVHWVVRDLTGLKALVSHMEETGQKNVIFYVLEQDDYNALAMNLAEMKRYIADQKAAKDFLVKSIATNAQTGTASDKK